MDSETINYKCENEKTKTFLEKVKNLIKTEIDNIPTKVAGRETVSAFENQVTVLLDNPKDANALEELNRLVYQIYDLIEEEQEVVEQRYY